MKLQLHLLPLLIQSAISTPISPETSLSLSPGVALSDPSAETANLPSLNTSSTSNTSFTGPTFLPHWFRVPTTDIVLRLSFGIIRHRIDPAELRSLLLLTKDFIQRGINVHSRHALFPASGNDHRQHFLESGLGTVELFITDFRDGTPFSWGDVWDVVEGLRLYLLEGGRSFETYFTFWEEPPSAPYPLYRRLGQGFIKRGSPPVERE